MHQRSWAACGVVLLVALGIGVSAVVAEPDGDPAADRLQALAERLERLERSIGILDGQALAPTILAQLQKGEDELSELERRFEDAGTGLPERQLEQMQQQMKKSAGEMKDLASRLSAVENQNRDDENLAAELRQANQQLRSLQTTLASLERRVAKLETK